MEEYLFEEKEKYESGELIFVRYPRGNPRMVDEGGIVEETSRG